MEGHAQSVMASYNAINGIRDATNKYLLTDIPRGEWILALNAGARRDKTRHDCRASITAVLL